VRPQSEAFWSSRLWEILNNPSRAIGRASGPRFRVIGEGGLPHSVPNRFTTTPQSLRRVNAFREQVRKASIPFAPVPALQQPSLREPSLKLPRYHQGGHSLILQPNCARRHAVCWMEHTIISKQETHHGTKISRFIDSSIR
jgi:hypothetical protein